jgi:anti-sigma factor RsiW
MHYIDGDLPERERASFDAHMAVCRPCREYLQTYRSSIKLCQAERPSYLPAIPEELVRAIVASCKSSCNGC